MSGFSNGIVYFNENCEVIISEIVLSLDSVASRLHTEIFEISFVCNYKIIKHHLILVL